MEVQGLVQVRRAWSPKVGSRISDSFGYLQRSSQGFSSVELVGLMQRLYVVCGDSKEEMRFDVMLGGQSRASHRGVIKLGC